MTEENEATVKILDSLCQRGGTPKHQHMWRIGQMWIILEDGGFSIPPNPISSSITPPEAEKWEKYQGFELLEKLAEDPEIAQRLAEPTE